MSAVPAWKRALLEKKKQQEQLEEQKKLQEKEAYIKSLPPWKRAIVIRDMEKAKTAGGSPAASSAESDSGNAPTPAQQDKWKAALSQANRLSSTSEKSETPAKTSAPWSGERKKTAINQVNASTRETGKPPWARKDSPNSPATPRTSATPVSTTDTPSPRTVSKESRGSIQSLASQFRKESSTSPPPVSPTVTTPLQKVKRETVAQKVEKTTPQETVVKKVPTQTQKETSPPLPANDVKKETNSTTPLVDDSDLVGLPSWKRALIIKKRMNKAGLTAPPPQQTEPANKPPTSSGRDETDFGKPPSPKPTSPAAKTAKKSGPVVVNRNEGDSSVGSNKLLEKEGVTLHPPIFNEVDQWANVATDDPKFTKLPQWKQAMILRRRKDIAKRSGQETSPPESPNISTMSKKRKGSSSDNEDKKTGRKSPTKTSGKMEGKKATSKAKSTGEKKASTKSSTKSKAIAEDESSSKSAKSSKTSSSTSKSKTSTTSGKHGGGSGLKPVRAAPTKPPEKKKKEVQEEKEEKKEEEKEEAMFTWNFSKHSVETGDAMSNSSDSELEDVQITSIDDELTDEDDSGIGGSGGTVLVSYKVIDDSVDEKKDKEKENKSTSPSRERSMSNSSSDPTMQKTLTRSESKPILIDPAKKSQRVSRVHNYCMYTHTDTP